jgi:uncharacterized protein (DUF2147 family)
MPPLSLREALAVSSQQAKLRRFRLALAFGKSVGIFLLPVLLTCQVQAAARVSDPVAGLWRTEGGKGIVELYSCGAKICGRFRWVEDDGPGNISLDTHNPDTAKRGRPLCRMQFMGGFKPDPDQPGHYEDGWIYSPHSGETYSAQMTLKDHNTLDLHGYVITPVLGESQIWKRAKSAPPCATAHS